MSKWEDISSFAQGDKDRIPSCFKLKVGQLVIKVHRHIHYADSWLVSGDLFRMQELSSKWIDAAKREAEMMLRKKLEQALHELKEVSK